MKKIIRDIIIYCFVAAIFVVVFVVGGKFCILKGVQLFEEWCITEENELREKVENGEIKIPGRSDEVAFTYGDNYVFYPAYDGDFRIHLVENGEDKGAISENVHSYRIKDDKMYLRMVEGFAVIDKNDNSCRVYLTIPLEEVKNKRQVNPFASELPPLFYAGILEHPLVTYYDFDEDLTREEQDKFISYV